MKAYEKHSIWLRWVHWLNVPFLFVMIWSGILIYWANDVYPGFFPEWFYRVFHIDHRLAEGMAIHFTIGWLLVLNGLSYFVYLFISGHWRELFPTRQTFRDLIPTILHDLKLRKTGPAPSRYNAAQRIAYTGIWFLGTLEVLSGFSIYKPVQLRWLTLLFGGYENARFIHFVAMLLFVFFILIHITQVIRSGWNGFRAMVAGFEIENEQK